MFAYSSYKGSSDDVNREVTYTGLDEFANAQRAYLAKYGTYTDNPTLLASYFSKSVTNGLSSDSGTISVFIDNNGNLWFSVKGDSCYVRFIPHPLSGESERSFSNNSLCSANTQSEN
ncbi:MAG: hypothetical protein ACKOW9_04420 [Candidatus Paceibacterota bacterium]